MHKKHPNNQILVTYGFGSALLRSNLSLRTVYDNLQTLPSWSNRAKWLGPTTTCWMATFRRAWRATGLLKPCLLIRSATSFNLEQYTDEIHKRLEKCMEAVCDCVWMGQISCKQENIFNNLIAIQASQLIIKTNATRKTCYNRPPLPLVSTPGHSCYGMPCQVP